MLEPDMLIGLPEQSSRGRCAGYDCTNFSSPTIAQDTRSIEWSPRDRREDAYPGVVVCPSCGTQDWRCRGASSGVCHRLLVFARLFEWRSHVDRCEYEPAHSIENHTADDGRQGDSKPVEDPGKYQTPERHAGANDHRHDRHDPGKIFKAEHAHRTPILIVPLPAL